MNAFNEIEVYNMSTDYERGWKVVSSNYVLQDRWICVRADNCIREDGVTIDPYYVFECRDWVHIICIDQNGSICLTHQYRHGAGRSVSELPCGVVNDGEEPLDAAKRELREETGINAIGWTALGSHSPNAANHNNRVFIFGCRLGEVSESQQDETEEIDWKFGSRDNVRTLIEANEFDQLLHLGSLLKASLSGFWSFI